MADDATVPQHHTRIVRNTHRAQHASHAAHALYIRAHHPTICASSAKLQQVAEQTRRQTDDNLPFPRVLLEEARLVASARFGRAHTSTQNLCYFFLCLFFPIWMLREQSAVERQTKWRFVVCFSFLFRFFRFSSYRVGFGPGWACVTLWSPWEPLVNYTLYKPLGFWLLLSGMLLAKHGTGCFWVAFFSSGFGLGLGTSIFYWVVSAF